MAVVMVIVVVALVAAGAVGAVVASRRTPAGGRRAGAAAPDLDLTVVPTEAVVVDLVGPGPVIDLSGDAIDDTDHADAVGATEATEGTDIVPSGDATDDAEGVVIDLSVAGRRAVPGPTETLEPEPDAVEHVLRALIERARFQQVGVEEVAAELVERADLRGEEVSEVLAELVGRAERPARSSELEMFNEAVPRRPGQLTDFADLAPAAKKRIIIRVLCLLVARSEEEERRARSDEGADGHADDGSAARRRTWPLARAVWGRRADGERSLPSRRLAKSG